MEISEEEGNDENVPYLPTPEQIWTQAAAIRAANLLTHRKTPCKDGRSEPRVYRDPRRDVGLI